MLAFEYRGSSEDIGVTVHAHPTLSEVDEGSGAGHARTRAAHLNVSGYFALDPRPLLPEDSQGTRILLMGALGVTPYIDRALEVLELAERGNDAEHRALVIARDGTVAGFVLFGAIAGTKGGARLHTAVLGARRRRR